MFNLGDWVIIRGRTECNGILLIGYVGRIVSSQASAPPNTIAVWIEWFESGVTDKEFIKNMPRKYNIEFQYLEKIDWEFGKGNGWFYR